jgi:hypothetical protein
MRFDRRLHSEHPNFDDPCLVCSQRGDRCDFRRTISLIFEAFASRSFSATSGADRSLDSSFDSSEGRAPKGSGPADAERGRGDARFTTREPPGASIEARGEYSSFHASETTAPWVSLSPASFAIAIGFAPNGITPKARRDRFLARRS